VGKTRQQILQWEGKWSLPTGLVTFVAVVMLIVSAIVVGSVNGSGDAEILQKAHEHSSDVTLSAILEAIGFVILVAPLYFLFRAASSRSNKMRTQLVGLVIAAPLFFAASAILNAAATNDAANAFTSGQSKPTLTVKEAANECESELKDKGAKDFGEEFDAGPTPTKDCEATKIADDEATNALSDASLRGAATGFGLGGRIGLAFALVYSCLYAMRVGLLTRFWGSLGMALGVAALLLLVQFSLIFFIYFGLLLIGKLPGGKPPAWAAGEAIPWPTPGEKVAAELQPDDPDAIDVDATEAPETTNGNGNGAGAGPGKKKRKRRGRG
jgi:hypothetical protein